MYEGYGPNGVALLIECLTDNKNRAAMEVRTAISRNGGNLADPGSVSYMFNRKGVVIVAKEQDGKQVEEDDVLEATLDAARGGGWVVGCGSLPPGAPIDLYATLTSAARAAGLSVAIDSSGEPMTHAAAALPNLIKPNHEELEELVGLYEAEGLSRATAETVARELTEKDALKAHLRAELGMDETGVVSPWSAAGASFVAFLLGALLPFLTIILAPVDIRVALTFVTTLLALAVTGGMGAWLGGARVLPAMLRVVIGGALALALTFAVGAWLGTTVA